MQASLSRRRILSRGALAAAAFAAPALVRAQAPRVMNLGFSTPVESDYGVLATKLAQLVKERMGDAIDVKIRCCATIATEDDAFKALQLGTVDAYFISSNNIAPHFPLLDILVLPYVFQGAAHVRKIREGGIADELAERLRKATNVHLLTWGALAHRDFYNSKRAINDVKDMAGLKVRVPKNEVMIQTFRAFGAEPIPLAWSETPAALQTGAVDGSDNGTSVIKSMKFYEFAKHLAILEHFAGFAPLLASPRFMGRLSPEQQKTFLQCAKEAGQHQIATVESEVETIRKFLGDSGMKVTRPNQKSFINAVLPLQDKFVAERGGEFKVMLDKIRAAAV
jgi:tripartite ATP-independent transporter DctP family solute receptor